MKQVFIALIVTMFALNLQAQTADSTTTPTEQEAPKNLTPAQQKAYDAKMKRQKDAADRKAEAEKRRQEAAAKRPGAKAATPAVTDSTGAPQKAETPAEKMRREAAEKRAAAAAQRKAAAEERAAKRPGAKPATPAVTDSTGAVVAPAKAETPAEKMRREAAEKRAALAAQRKAAAEERAAKKPGAKPATPATGADSTAAAAPPQESKAEQTKREATEKREAVAAQRKAEAEKRKQEAEDKKQAAEQLKASGVGASKTAAKATPEEKAQMKKEADALKPVRTPRGKNTAAATAPAVVSESQIAKLYYTLPLAALPQVAKYLDEHPDVKESVDNEKSKDPNSGSMHDTRKGLINKEDANKNYLQIGQLEKYTRLQMFSKQAMVIMAIETDECTPECKNTFKIYSQSDSTWDDVTDQYLPKIDKKYVLGKIKSAYKKQYTDNTVYEAKGYETDENVYQNAVVYNLSPDNEKITVRDQNIDLPIYEITWDPVKGKFNLVKL